MDLENGKNEIIEDNSPINNLIQTLKTYIAKDEEYNLEIKNITEELRPLISEMSAKELIEYHRLVKSIKQIEEKECCKLINLINQIEEKKKRMED